MTLSPCREAGQCKGRGAAAARVDQAAAAELLRLWLHRDEDARGHLLQQPRLSSGCLAATMHHRCSCLWSSVMWLMQQRSRRRGRQLLCAVSHDAAFRLFSCQLLPPPAVSPASLGAHSVPSRAAARSRVREKRRSASTRGGAVRSRRLAVVGQSRLRRAASRERLGTAVVSSMSIAAARVSFPRETLSPMRRS